MKIRPLRTSYRGVSHRSRLEARWAVFFHNLGIVAEYEPQGYSVAGDAYLPDFYLPQYAAFVEIKPTAFRLLDEYHRDRVRLEVIDSVWNAEETDLDPLYVLSGPPHGCVVIRQMDWGMSACRLASCRRCDGLCYEADDQWGDIGTHGCNSERRPDAGSARLAQARVAAMEARF